VTLESVTLPVIVSTASESDLPELASVAAQTFPLACPPSVAPENVAAFIAANLSAEKFSSYLRDPERRVFVARSGGRILGYAMLIHGVPDDATVQEAVSVRPAIELSKLYVLPAAHGAGAASALMEAVLEYATSAAVAAVWLGVNQKNERAQRFYAKHGFTRTGVKTMTLGGHVENDYVMLRELA
jgi:ribosomal protein S18 acetylase RimI-like enzyme